MFKLDEPFGRCRITRRKIIKDIGEFLETSFSPNDSRVTREMCLELARDLDQANPKEKDYRYTILLGRIANASGLHMEACRMPKRSR